MNLLKINWKFLFKFYEFLAEIDLFLGLITIFYIINYFKININILNDILIN